MSADGDITFAGNLADGTTVSQSSAVSKDGRWPMYLPSSNPNESVFGWNYFTNQTLTAPALVSWINVTNKAKSGLYPSGFTNQEAAIVASYYNPTQKPLLSLTEAQVTLEEAACLSASPTKSPLRPTTRSAYPRNQPGTQTS